MTLSSGSISKALFSAIIIAPTLAPLIETLPFSVPFSFASVANLKILAGTFTPANDIHTIVTGLSVAPPNFVILLVDAMAVFGDAAFRFIEVPVSKFFMTTIPTPDMGQPAVNGWVLNGQAGFTNPMVQGSPVNYMLITGQATIT